MTVKAENGGGPLALVAVFISAAGFAACLTGVYLAMRDLMINQGGACASGGPYAINPDQVCSGGQVALLMGGVFLGLVFAGVLIAASGRWGGNAMAGVGLLLWAALFGALGYNFIELGINPPEKMGGTAGWIISGVVFWLMALGGLIPGLMAIAGYFRSADMPVEEQSAFNRPIVRANVSFERNMPGDPAFGQTNPQSSAGTPSESAVEPRRIDTADEFIDPVTGEKIGGDDG